MSGRAITATMSAPSHLDSRVRDVLGDSLHPTIPGTEGHTGKSTRHDENRWYVQLSTYGKNRIYKKRRNKSRGGSRIF